MRWQLRGLHCVCVTIMTSNAERKKERGKLKTKQQKVKVALELKVAHILSDLTAKRHRITTTTALDYAQRNLQSEVSHMLVEAFAFVSDRAKQHVGIVK